MSDDTTNVTPPPGEKARPRVLGGRYELGALVGRGGMADVHAGEDLRLGRPVAIKILRTDLARDSSFLARFRREAQSAAGLSHPSIVAVYDSGEETVHEAGGAPVQVPYIVMEYLEGKTLRELLNDSPDKVLPPDEAARITAAVLSALDYAHARGLVHRDIKPANVMVTRTGAVKVMDFGIARALADTAATMTQTSAVMGTARYLSPEQAQGLDVDGRSDLYSVGCLLYELLVGRTPFQGDPVSLVYQHLGETPKPPSTLRPLPESIEAITLHALEKDPDERYQSAADFRADLHAFRADRPVSEAAAASLAGVLRAGDPGRVAAGEEGPGAWLGAGAGAAAAARSQRAMADTQAVPVPDRGPDGPRELRPDRREEARDEERWERTDELPVRERRHRGAGFLLGALALLAVAGVAYVLFQVFGPGSGPPEPVQVTVPSTIGQPEARAREMIREANLTVGGVFPRHSDREIGTVIGQNPEGGMAVEGSAVDLEISAGPEAIPMPDLRGWEEDAARAELARLKFTNVAAEATETDSPDHEKGEVIATTPGGGQALAPGTEIILEVGTGKVKMPDLVDKTRDEAVLLIHDNALTLEEVQLLPTWEHEPGTVLEQSRQEGERLDHGTGITIVVAEQPQQIETVTTEVTVRPVPPPTTEPPPTTPDPTQPEEPTDPTDPTTDPPGPTNPPVDPPGRPTPPPTDPPSSTE